MTLTLQSVVAASDLGDSVACRHTSKLVPSCEQSGCVTCQMVSKLRTACESPLPLENLAQQVHLPLSVCMRVVRDGIRRGWLVVAETALPQSSSTPASLPVHPLWNDLASGLEETLGSDGLNLLTKAQQMTQHETETSAEVILREVLIAVELLLSAGQSHQMTPMLERLYSRLDPA